MVAAPGPDFPIGHDKLKCPTSLLGIITRNKNYKYRVLLCCYLKGGKRALMSNEVLPSLSWWTDPKIFELEKRAVLFKSWIYVTHAGRFKKAGDYLSFAAGGLNFFLIKNKAGEINAFHNVCRHRAYPVVKKDAGTSIILGCKYHGWSYNTDGALTKAPQFENVKGFDKSQNSLFKIRSHVTNQGLVFINFDSSEVGPPPLDAFYSGLEQSLGQLDLSDYEHHATFNLEGQFNWKTLMDGPTTAQRSKSFSIPPSGKVEEHSKWAKSSAQLLNSNGPDLDGSWFYLFPTSGINCYRPGWYSIRVLPIAPNKTALQYDVYKKKGTSDEQFEPFVELVKKVEQEDLQLCESAYVNLKSAETDPQSLGYHSKVKEMVVEHYEQEKKAGREINPAFLGTQSSSETGQMLDRICQELECGSGPENPILAW